MKEQSFVKEWLSSKVDLEIIALNVRELDGANALNELFISPRLPRKNGGRVVEGILKQYDHIYDHGGWWVSGVDPLKGYGRMDWGQFKPYKPRTVYDPKTGKKKPIKYEAPPKAETRVVMLKVSPKIWRAIALTHSLEIPEIKVGQDGEGVGFWRWVVENNLPIIITEGAKKAGAALTAGYPAIALPGINSGYRSSGEYPKKKRALIPDLEAIATPDRKVYIAFDNDDKASTKKNVQSAIAAMGRLFVDAGCDTRVLEWEQYQEKGLDDLIAAHGANVLHEQFRRALTLRRWKHALTTKLSYKPDYVTSDRYLKDLPIPDDAKIICIKSPKGTGKTEVLGAIAQQAQYEGRWTLALTHRVQLGQALADRLGIPYVSEMRSKENELGQSLGYALCVDSLHMDGQARFDATYWEDGVVIIDEVEQVIFHLIESQTCREKRTKIFDEFTQLLRNAINSPQGKIIISDADLSDYSINFIRDLTGYLGKPWLAVNDWKPSQAWKVTHYDSSSPAPLLMALERHISAGGRPLICCSGQQKKASWGTQNLEARLSSLFPELKILRMDSESIADPNHPAFGCIRDLNQVLQEYDIAIASPTLETGVSIDIKGHFTSVWGIFQGIAPEHSARQALARLREPVDRHVWANAKGIAKIGSGDITARSLVSSQNKVSKQNIEFLRQAGWDDEIDEDETDNVYLQTWGRMGARVNQGFKFYRDCIIGGLEEEGHIIVKAKPEQLEEEKEIKKELKELAEFCQQEEAEKIAEAEEISSIEYEKLNAQKARTEQERRELKKKALSLRYGVDVTPDLIAKDADGWYPQLLLHYYMSVGRDHLRDRDKKKAKAQIEAGRGKLWKPDFNRALLSTSIHLLKKLGISAIADRCEQGEDRELRKTDEDLIELAKLAKLCAWEIKAGLGITIGEKMSEVEVARRLLEKIGFEVKYLKREVIMVDGEPERQRVYTVSYPEDQRQDIFIQWLERDESALASLTSTETI
jgi:hypothetical protein